MLSVGGDTVIGGDVDILSFWGKARPCRANIGPDWHPLAFHCLDVAAVGQSLLDRHQGLGDSLTQLLDLHQDQVFPFLRYLICLHDIGKFAKSFQAKAAQHYPSCFPDDPAQLAADAYDHGAGGLRLFNACEDIFHLPGPGEHTAWRPLISAVTGHHGSPPALHLTGPETSVTLRPDFGRLGIEAARAFAREAHEILAASAEFPRLDRKCARRASFSLAGLTVLADWIGSNQNWFPYRGPGDFESLATYWDNARKLADQAVTDAGILPTGTGAGLSYGALIGSGVTPTPMQEWARTVNIPSGPTLFMIEDETGSGKTEAALMLAYRLMAADRADGLYVALPTMATANAMFERLGKSHRLLFATDQTPSIALAHGSRDLHRDFRAATLRGGRDETPYSCTVNQESETTASTACAAWIADDRRRAFLADAGAGTVDQALLAVLPNRYQSLRLLGLMRRVLVLDEVHAYDAYMRREIEALLEFQAGLGGSAILLSATLPLGIRENFSAAFSKGLGEQIGTTDLTDDSEMDYPLA